MGYSLGAEKGKSSYRTFFESNWEHKDDSLQQLDWLFVSRKLIKLLETGFAKVISNNELTSSNTSWAVNFSISVLSISKDIYSYNPIDFDEGKN